MTRWLAMAVFVLGCGKVEGGGGDDGGGGGGGVGTPCRDGAACAMDLFCADSDDPPVCGIAPREGCASDSDCMTGEQCHAIDDSCSPDGIGSECRPPCVDDASCGSGFLCTAGACAAVLCDAGFTCLARQVCDPARIGATAPVFNRHHGCFAVECVSDATCGQRLCVNGTCQDSLGACAEPMAVP